MNAIINLSRRNFLKTGVFVGGGLIFGVLGDRIGRAKTIAAIERLPMKGRCHPDFGLSSQQRPTALIDGLEDTPVWQSSRTYWPEQETSS